MGGARRGKTTFGKELAEKHKLTHLCTDPQRLLPLTMNGTPDELAYDQVGEWVALNWLNRERSLIEGVKAHSALRFFLDSGPSARSSQVCDRLIVLTERTGDEEPLAGQERQAERVMAFVEDYQAQLDNLELWFPIGGTFQQADF